YNRRSLLNAMQTMEWAVSSPYASPATVQLLGRPLADALLPASKKELPQEVTLLLEPDPELHRLAWAALPTSQGPLGLHVAIAEIPSVLAEHASASAKPVSFSTDASPSAARPLVIGASVAGGNAALLPEAIEEARRVGAYLHAPELLLGSQATAHNVAAEMSHASLLHFAGHAVQDDWGMRLLLAYEPEADAHLDAPEPHPWIDEAFLRTHPPRACRLAVLSACATGGNAPSGQAPLRDLVKMLYSLGVPEVVATRWPVDSEASVTFMKAFYSSLDSGQDVAHALRSARLAQSKIEIYENPYFWGAYYATGREEFSFKGERHANANDRGGLGRTQERSFQGR
ncbi:MAG TPA: CHAT domain-containing protein, partial [Acidobacteriaceae bacterium]